ncbi:MAG: TonB family protein [SAR86 cluster bacterium]|uniref:TonB family protein n=1 Tax=SAR86 cluster bacterium TaxID=2030880 RepID=A0A520N228_9GAMM|nr:MAG: TonB family protein [SAR86 cluster bacterium]
MRINKVYLEASFISFLIHASIILYLLGYFYLENNQISILSKPIQVNLVFQDTINKQKQKTSQLQNSNNEIILESNAIKKNIISEKSISFESLISSTSIEDLLNEDNLIFQESDKNQIEIFSSLIIQSLQSAWRKPINIQDNLVCDLRLNINKNGRIVNASLIKSSGNIRFDNSALMAVQRVETFSFFNNIPYNIYSSNFKNIVIKFNPS